MARIEAEEVGLDNLRPKPGTRKDRKRKGRGHGSGNGKTAGRGHKGAGARAGAKKRAGHEGGPPPGVTPPLQANDPRVERYLRPGFRGRRVGQHVEPRLRLLKFAQLSSARGALAQMSGEVCGQLALHRLAALGIQQLAEMLSTIPAS